MLSKAQSEAFRNALSLDRHLTLMRTVLGTCCKWCRSKAGTYINPEGEDFARHANCNCLFTVSGYKSRNGILNNYVRSRNSPYLQEQLKPTLQKFYDNPNEVTIGFARLLEGQTKQITLGNIRSSVSEILGINRKANIILTDKQARHINKAGHLSGAGYVTLKEAKNGKGIRTDKYPLTVKEITQIPEIIKKATPSKISLGDMVRGKQRYMILGDTQNRQVVVVDFPDDSTVSVISSYRLSRSQYIRRLGGRK